MSHTVPLVIPLTEGLDLSKEAMLGQKELKVASNVDFSVQGRVAGRPSRAAVEQFVARTALVSGEPGTVRYASAGTFASTGFTPLGMMRLRDGTDERAMLGCAGRLFVNEGTQWRDRGHFACARVDRPLIYQNHEASTATRALMGPDFGVYPVDSPTASSAVALFSPETLGFEQYVTQTRAHDDVGGMAKCGTTTASLYRSGANLYLITRANGAATLTETVIAADAADWINDGDAPSICCDHDQTVFFVAYQTTTADQYKVLRVTIAGSVSATYTGSLVGIHGIWVSNSSVAGNTCVVGLTNAAGLTIKVLNATTMGDNAKDSTIVAGTGGREVVVGVESSTRAWWAYRAPTGTATTEGLYIGVVDPTTVASAVTLRIYRGGVLAGTRYHTPMHQPVLYGGRMYLTVANAAYPDSTSPAVGTWFTLDLSNLHTVGPFTTPTLVARGALDGACHAMGTSGAVRFQPESAVLFSSGWTFPSIDWLDYQTVPTQHDFSVGTATKGLRSSTVLNYVSMSGPRAVIAGGATLFSGSVPHALAGDQCYEAGFPGGRPLVGAALDGADGNITVAGDYTIYVLWAYTDGSGQVHRSNASALTQTIGVSDAVDLWIENPWFTERPDGDVRIEIYSTGPDPTGDSLAYLQATVTPTWTAGSTTYKLFDTADVVTGTKSLYILDGEFIHHTPSADGGIAALGRRVWVADGASVHASLLLQPREGVVWNDEGSLSVTLPAGAGRILALEALDDKLVIFCERGVYALQDSGPDNTGLGPDIAFPVRLSDLGCAGPRSTCVTDLGVAFCSPLDSTDSQRGGPWLLDRSLSMTQRKYLGSPAMTAFLASGSWSPEVAYSPERQHLYVTSNQVASADPPTVGSAGGAVTLTDQAASQGVVVIDMRYEKWSTWDLKRSWGDLRSIDVVSGVLWVLNDEPAAFSGAPGSDASGGDYSMRIRTAHYAANGQDGGGWARVRAVTPIAAVGATTHTLKLFAWADETYCMTSGSITQTTPAVSGTWPTNRLVPEWRLSSQKCAVLQLEVQASPATARWSALRLDVQPLPPRAPAGTRV
jgi:hypothetical protein